METITSDQGTKYDIVDIIYREEPFLRGQYTFQKSSNQSETQEQSPSQIESEKRDFGKPIRVKKYGMYGREFLGYFFYNKDGEDCSFEKF